jgi:hypothetical protein
LAYRVWDIGLARSSRDVMLNRDDTPKLTNLPFHAEKLPEVILVAPRQCG